MSKQSAPTFVFPLGGDPDFVGNAYVNQRARLAEMRPALDELLRAIDFSSNLMPQQWAQLVATTLEFGPDLIIELGRGRGNSTAAFAETIATTGVGRLLSLCISDDWTRISGPRVRVLRPDPGWWGPLDLRLTNINDIDWKVTVGDARRVLVFWDAHGFSVASSVLGALAPVLAEREHIVLMHDISDARFNPTPDGYGGDALWNGGNEGSPKYRIGHVHSGVEQIISILDFAWRNDMPVHSADESIHRAVEAQPAAAAEMSAQLGEFYSPLAHWHWFRLSEARYALEYPRPPAQEPFMSRLRIAAKILLNRQ